MRGRGACFALALALFGVSVSANQNPAAAAHYQAGKCPAEYQPGQSCTPRPPPGAILEESPSPKIYDPKCGEPKDHDEADLCVQREVRDASKDTVWWASAQTVIGFFGILATIAALFVAIRSANHSRESANIARRTLTDIQRAWLFVQIERFQNPATAFVTNGELDFTFRNYGTMPATIESFYANLLMLRKPFDRKSFIGREDFPEDAFVIPVGSASTPISRTVALPDGWQEAIRGQLSFLYLYGHVGYEAAPGANGETFFCFVYSVKRGRFIPAQREFNQRT